MGCKTFSVIIVALFLLSSLAVFADGETDVCCSANGSYSFSTQAQCDQFGGNVVDNSECSGSEEGRSFVCCQFSSESGGSVYEWKPQVNCTNVVDNSNCAGGQTTPVRPIMPMEGTRMMPAFCNSPKECMKFCREYPTKCKYEFKQHEGEKLKIKGEYGSEYDYKFNSENGNEVVDIEYHDKDFGYDEIKPEYIIMGKMTEGIDHAQFEEFMRRCPDVQSMVDGLINKLKELGRWNISKACDQIGDTLSNCREKTTEGCDNIGKGTWLRYGDNGDTEIKCGDNVNKEDFFNICISKSGSFEGTNNAEQHCEDNWEHMAEGCKERKKYCEEFQQKAQEQSNQARDMCDRTRQENNMTEEDYQRCIQSVGNYPPGSCDAGPGCNRDEFLSQCRSQTSAGIDRGREMIREKCNTVADQMLEQFNQGCERRQHAYDQCTESTQKHCGVLADALDKCRTVTEDRLREVMIEKGTMMCKFMENKDKDEFIRKMIEARKHFKDNSEDQLVFDQKTDDVISAKEDVKTVEDKNFGYKLKKFFGLAAEQERADAGKLRESAKKLRKTAQFLRDLADNADSEQTKGALLEQAINLESEADNLEEIAKDKSKRARGLWSIFSSGEEASAEQTPGNDSA